MIRLIAALDNQLGIAKDGAVPWDIPDDRRFFREMTSSKGARVLMGSRTFEVIGHPLKIVVILFCLISQKLCQELKLLIIYHYLTC